MFEKLEQLQFWCQKVIPLVYEDSLSYYELLCKVVKYLNDLISNQNTVNLILAEYGKNIKDLQDSVLLLQTELEKVKNGDYVSLYIDSLSKWIDNNLQELVGKIVKYVFFEIDDTGHFVAYIPSAWQFLEFDTIMDNTSENYGHLVLTW